MYGSLNPNEKKKQNKKTVWWWWWWCEVTRDHGSCCYIVKQHCRWNSIWHESGTNVHGHGNVLVLFSLGLVTFVDFLPGCILEVIATGYKMKRTVTFSKNYWFVWVWSQFRHFIAELLHIISLKLFLCSNYSCAIVKWFPISQWNYIKVRLNRWVFGLCLKISIPLSCWNGWQHKKHQLLLCFVEWLNESVPEQASGLPG